LTIGQTAEYCGVDRTEVYHNMLRHLEVRRVGVHGRPILGSKNGTNGAKNAGSSNNASTRVSYSAKALKVGSLNHEIDRESSSVMGRSVERT
jgi:hypothetical protein